MKKAARTAALAAAAYLGLLAGLEPAREGGHRQNSPRGDPAAAVYLARPRRALSERSPRPPCLRPSSTTLDRPRPSSTVSDNLRPSSATAALTAPSNVSPGAAAAGAPSAVRPRPPPPASCPPAASPSPHRKSRKNPWHKRWIGGPQTILPVRFEAAHKRRRLLQTAAPASRVAGSVHIVRSKIAAAVSRSSGALPDPSPVERSGTFTGGSTTVPAKCRGARRICHFLSWAPAPGHHRQPIPSRYPQSPPAPPAPTVSAPRLIAPGSRRIPRGEFVSRVGWGAVSGRSGRNFSGSGRPARMPRATRERRAWASEPTAPSAAGCEFFRRDFRTIPAQSFGCGMNGTGSRGCPGRGTFPSRLCGRRCGRRRLP